MDQYIEIIANINIISPYRSFRDIGFSTSYGAS